MSIFSWNGLKTCVQWVGAVFEHIAKLSQAPAQLSGAELALFLENPDHPPTRRPPGIVVLTNI